MAMSGKDHSQVISRNIRFAERATTRIWEELPDERNPYITAAARCHGYDLLELMQRRGFADVFYLLFRGELPDRNQAGLLEALMIAQINPGPRHPATRAAVNTAVGKTDPNHILPISLSILSGEHLGSAEVEAAMRFLRRHGQQDPAAVAQALLAAGNRPSQGDWHIAPGFGSRFGGIDVIQAEIANHLCSLPGDWAILKWGAGFAAALAHHDMGWLSTGVAAAALCDLGFHPRAGGGLYQLLSAPGLLAHGQEYCNKPITALPRVSDEDYVIEDANN